MGRAQIYPVEGPRHGTQHLPEVIEQRRDALVDEWFRAAAEPPDERARGELQSFLERLTSALRASPLTALPPQELELEAGEAPKEGSDQGGSTRNDLDAAAATRAYGSLHRLILEVAAERNVDVSLAEHMVLASHVNAAVLRAVAASARRHQETLHRVAHKLRNPLGSATMALTLLRSRVDLADNARLAEMLERNLQRLGGLIDEAVDRG
jgi:signal transduction histidine kinase